MNCSCSAKLTSLQTMANPEKKLSVNDLPLYKSDEEHVYIEDGPLLLQPFVAKRWEFFEPSYELLRDGYAASGELYKELSAKTQKIPDRFTDENQITVAKAVAIAVGGMGGYLYAMRRGGLLRRAFYSGVGMTLLAAFCYPHQTMDIGRDIAHSVKAQWSEIMPPSEPPSSKPSGAVSSDSKESAK